MGDDDNDVLAPDTWMGPRLRWNVGNTAEKSPEYTVLLVPLPGVDVLPAYLLVPELDVGIWRVLVLTWQTP